MSVSRKEIHQLSPSEVIDMFRGIELLVTDDDQLIAGKIKELEDRYRRMKNEGGSKTAKANEWFEDTKRLSNRADRHLLHEIVYAQFVGQVELQVQFAIREKITTVDAIILARLEQIARNTCKCDESLAKQFVERIRNEKKWSDGERLVDPRLVENARVGSVLNNVELFWTLPDSHCDSVIIRRTELNPNGSRKSGHGETVFSGHATSFTDRKVKVGGSYCYDLYSVEYGQESAGFRTLDVTVITEISVKQPEWEPSRVRLSWDELPTSATVYIFRSTQAILLDRSAREPQPVSAQSALVYRGKGSSFIDQQIELGQTYHYLFVAAYDAGLYTEGVIREARTPKPPPLPARMEARYVGNGVRIEWDEVSDRESVKYFLLRKVGEHRSVDLDDGEGIVETYDTTYLDTHVYNGDQFTYTVFTCWSGLYSAQGRASNPVTVTADVADLVIEEHDTIITLRWNTPPEAESVVIRRSLNPITSIADGTPVSLTGAGVAQDAGLQNLRTYHYWIGCTYQLPTGAKAYSSGRAVVAQPHPLPGKITRFSAENEGNYVICRWEQEGSGNAVVVRSAKPFYAEGSLINQQDLNRAGEQLSASAPHMTMDVAPVPSSPVYTVYVVSGWNVRVGPSHKCLVFEDVRNLQAKRESSGVRLRWDWPRTQTCRAVMIARRYDAMPEGIDDPLAHCYPPYSLAQYENNYNSFLDTDVHPGKAYYVVYAQPHDAPERVYAPGSAPGARAVVETADYGQMRYRVEIKHKHQALLDDSDEWAEAGGSRKLRRLSQSMRRALVQSVIGVPGISLTWQFTIVPERFSGFVLVGKNRSVPSHAADGVTLFEWKPSRELSRQVMSAWTPFSTAALDRLHGRFFCRLFYLNRTEYETVVLIHPDITQALILR